MTVGGHGQRDNEMESIINGHVLWSFDYEVLNTDFLHVIGAHFSGVKPFHAHEGQVALTDEHILITGDRNLEIPLKDLQEIFLGFDETFPSYLSKNFGLFWQPLRMKLKNGEQLYLIIDHNMFGTKNQLWFNGLKQMLSD